MTGISALPRHLQQRLQAELTAGESILWAGQPKPWQSTRLAFMTWFFFVPFTAACLMLWHGMTGFRVPCCEAVDIAVAVVGELIAALCLLGLSIPWWSRRAARSRIYAVTDQRAIVIEGHHKFTVKSYLARDLGDIDRTEHRDGSGAVLLGLRFYRNDGGDWQSRPEGFRCIDGVHRVATLASDLADSAHPRRATHDAAALTDLSALPPHLQQRLRAELQANEVLLWTGQPSPGRTMKSANDRWAYFLAWTVLCLLWMYSPSGYRWLPLELTSNVSPWFGLPFLLFGLGCLGIPLWARRKARSTIYAITSRRALSIEGAKSLKVKSFLARTPGDIQCTEYRDGTGDLMLRTDYYRGAERPVQTGQHGFYAVDGVRQVEALVRHLGRSHGPDSGA